MSPFFEVNIRANLTVGNTCFAGRVSLSVSCEHPHGKRIGELCNSVGSKVGVVVQMTGSRRGAAILL